ncbi:hypothetical protein ES703_13710 [subsurface metagenome]
MGVKQVMPGVFKFDPAIPDDVDDSERLATLIRISNLAPGTRLTKRFINFEEVPGRKEGLEAAFQLVKGEIQPPLLLLYGLPGRSKTHLAMAIAWAFIIQLQSAVFYQVGELLDALREGYRIQRLLAPGEYSPDATHVIINQVKKCQLLVLDDMGVQDKDWAVEKLDLIVNYRYEEKLATVITANTLEIPDRVYDRMLEGKVVKLSGESYRAIIQKRKQR